MVESRLDELLITETAHVAKLHQIVIDAVEEEKLISEKLYEFEDQNPPLSGRIADYIALFGGSWRFIISFLLVMTIWVAVNTYVLEQPFDPFPFILLNLVLSTIAALQAPVIMMSQNRKDEKDRKRAVNDYLVNLKAEIEIRNVHQKLDLLIAEQMKTLFDLQNAQLDIMKEIKQAIELYPGRTGDDYNQMS
jgi:uncharacterized membrane protein